MVAAGCLAVALLFASPAAAQGGDGNKGSLKEWDTDNLSRWTTAGQVGGRNYRIPFHDYRGYVDRTPAKPCIQYIAGGSVLARSRYDGSCPSGYSLLTRWCSYGYVDDSTNAIRYTKIERPYSTSGRLYDACPSRSGYPYRQLRTSGNLPQLCGRSILSLSRNCATRADASKLKHAGCQSAVADAFFQTGGSTGAVNDFPIASYGSESAAGTVTATGSRDRGCAVFAEQQDRLQASVTATGHYLDADSAGKLILKSNSTDALDTRITSARSAGVYGRWDQKGTGYEFAQQWTSGNSTTGGVYAVAPADGYRDRVDTRTALAVGSGLSSGLLHPWNTASGLGAMNRNLACTGGSVTKCVKRTPTTSGWGGAFDTLGSAALFRVSGNHGSGIWLRQVHLSAAQDAGGGWCLADWHPRGQDAAYAISNSTGRTLSSINSEALLKLADAHWCRSDVRYELKFTAQQHNTCGTNRNQACAGPPGVVLPVVGTDFPSYGRKNCYKTMTGYDEANAECEYVFPLPKCDPDPDNGTETDWREFNAAEVDNIGVAGEPLLVKEGAYCGTNINPPDLAGFDADPCVVVDVAVFENRTSGSEAEPGVDSADRTVAVSASVAVFDLDISAPFSETASPPRDTTAGSEDPSGCADGEEERTSHGARANPSDSVLPAASDQRKSTAAASDPRNPHAAPYPLPSSSSASNTAAPPSDYDADNSYAGVRANIAHRYASEIAENTCAAKKAEADIVLAALEAREDSFEQWLDDYKTAADSNKAKFTNYTAVSAGASGLSAYWAADIATERTRAAAALKTAYENLSSALVSAKRAYRTATDQQSDLSGTTADDRARVVAPASASGCAAHYDAEIARLKKLFSDAEDDALGRGANGIAEEVLAVKNNAPKNWDRPVVKTASFSITLTPSDPLLRRHSTSSTRQKYDCDEDGVETCKTRTVTTCSGYSYTRRGTTSGSYTRKSRSVNADGNLVTTEAATPNTDSRSFSATYTVDGGSYKSTDTVQGCPSTASVSGTTQTQNEANIRGREGTVTAWPTIDKPAKPTAIYTSAQTPAFMLESSLLLGRYHPEHDARDDLDDPDQLTRANAAIALGTLTADNSDAARTPADYASLAVPETQNLPTATATRVRAAVETAAASYRKAYTDAYNRAYTRARADMGGTGSQQQAVWRNFHWEYDADSLLWGGYTQNTTTDTTLDDGTVIQGQAGCDLMRVASDGTTTIAATRLDYETGSYGLGNTFTARTAEQRECKIRRTRTPRLTLRYEPPTTTATSPWRTCPATMTAATLPCGTDTHSSKTGDYYNTAFTPDVAGAQKFKLYPRKDTTEPSEAEIFNLRISIADSPPVLCYQPGEALVAHVGARGIDAVNQAVFRNASGFRGGNKKHCYRHPSAAHLGSPRRPAFVFFDDTAHSAMASVSVVWQQPNPKIVSKVGSTDDLKMMANTVSLIPSSPVPFVNATRTSVFYGTYYTFPTDTSVKSPSGWNIASHPSLTLASTFTQHQVQAKDAAAKTPSTHTMVFKFVDCVFGIEDVAFVDNIASPYALLSDENGVVPSGWKQTYDRDPHNSPTWYYPAFSTYEGARRLDGRRDSNGDPITYGRNTQGGFAHPSYDLENTAADGMGWGIVYEDKVGKQQPVWGIYAPPVPRDSSPIARQVCGANTLGAGGANPAATTGTPAARRIGTPATPPPASGAWTWKTSAWNYQDNPIMLWSADDDPNRDDPWEIKVSDSSAYLPRKPHNNLEFATEDSNVAALDVFRDASNPAPSGYSRLEDQDMVLANFAMVNLNELESDTNPDNPGLRERAQRGGITCGYNWWYCFRPAPAGYRLWGKSWMAKRQLCIGFNFKLVRWSSTIEDALVSTLDNPDRNERGIPIRLRLGYIVGGIPTPGEPHPDSYYESSTFSTAC